MVPIAHAFMHSFLTSISLLGSSPQSASCLSHSPSRIAACALITFGCRILQRCGPTGGSPDTLPALPVHSLRLSQAPGSRAELGLGSLSKSGVSGWGLRSRVYSLLGVWGLRQECRGLGSRAEPGLGSSLGAESGQGFRV
eukprot:1185485-Rhodomonas_salina.1